MSVLVVNVGRIVGKWHTAAKAVYTIIQQSCRRHHEGEKRKQGKRKVKSVKHIIEIDRALSDFKDGKYRYILLSTQNAASQPPYGYPKLSRAVGSPVVFATMFLTSELAKEYVDECKLDMIDGAYPIGIMPRPADMVASILFGLKANGVNRIHLFFDKGVGASYDILRLLQVLPTDLCAALETDVLLPIEIAAPINVKETKEV